VELDHSRVDCGILPKNKRKLSKKKKCCKKVKSVVKLEEPLLLVKGMVGIILSHAHFISCFHSSDDNIGVIEEDDNHIFEGDSSRGEEGSFLV